MYRLTKNERIILGLPILLLATIVSWQIIVCYVADSELQSDMQDLAVQNPARIGLVPISTEEELRTAVIADAKEHGILLAPEQVTVVCRLTPGMLDVSIRADYDARVNVLGLLFPIHFAPSTSHSGTVVVK